jgi:hypothetical protein
VVNEYPERHDSLWWVAAAPAIWAVHFMACYATAAVWCAKLGAAAPLGGARVAIFVYTALALAALGVVAWRGQRRYAVPGERTDADSSGSRHRFVGFTLLSLSGLGGLAVVYEAFAAVFIGSCS